jgi:molybdopterin-containing oxidoreductase family iron-sulfur binding subunit
LESWGDAKTRTGFYSLQQPVIYPIFNTRQKEAVLLTWISGACSNYNLDLYHNYLIDNWKKNIYPGLNSKLDFLQFWNGALHDGVVLNKENGPANGSFNSSALNELKNTNNSAGYVVALKESYLIGDGRFSNNGWLNELPHPVSKIAWDNYASVSRGTARELGVKTGDFIEIAEGKNKLKIPVNIQPGCTDKTITIELGYGRKNSGTVAEGVGFNANILQSPDSNISNWIISPVEVKKSGGSYPIAVTQEFHAYDKGILKDAAQKRSIIKEGTVEQYKKNLRILNYYRE